MLLHPRAALLLIPALAGCLQAVPSPDDCVPEPGLAQGRVLHDGWPVEGALVWWHVGNLTREGTLETDAEARLDGVVTDEDGFFALPGTGSELRIQAPGLLAATVPARSCQDVPVVDDLRVIGHRGTAFHAPENTLTAVRVAAGQGADVVELDVRRTADDVLVVWHDAGLERVAGLPLDLAALSWAALSGLRVEGAGYEDRVPLLSDALGAADAQGVEVLLDLKGSPRNVTRTLELLGPLLDSRDAWGHTWLAVRYDSNVDECLAWPQARCVVQRFGGNDPVRLPVEKGVPVVALRDTAVEAAWVEEAHAAGLEVWAWTVNLEDDWTAMVEAGVDGIVTDRPQELADAVRRMHRQA